MGVFNSILFDKSAFESFNVEEIFFLQQYYFPVVSHILIIEILADLKQEKPGRDSQVRVQQLAHKILQLKPSYTMNYQELIKHELFGYHVDMSRRPIISQGSRVVGEDGKKGVVIEEMLEEQILQRWQSKKFDEAEKLSADQWHRSNAVNKIDISKHERPQGIDDLKTLDDVNNYVGNYLKKPNVQRDIITNIIAVYGVNPKIASQVFYKYETKQFSMLSDIAPYCVKCYRMYLVFSLAIARGIHNPRRTDIIDLQYLYYLPFSSIFTSDDKFHKRFTPLFLEDDQSFISGKDLKNDLGIFVSLRKEQDEDKRAEWTRRYSHYPPSVDSSFTVDMWDRNVPETSRKYDDPVTKRTPAENKDLVDRLNKLANSPLDSQTVNSDAGNEPEFIMIKRKRGRMIFAPVEVESFSKIAIGMN